MALEFKGFPKIPRFTGFGTTITEKIDGTNAGVFVDDDGYVTAASRKRWITPEADNFGFAQWVADNTDQLLTLGPGMHWGEWWGQGIQRGYGLTERRFSLFNVSRWDPKIREGAPALPDCCGLVPVLAQIPIFTEAEIRLVLQRLGERGSLAAPGFTNPEGIVINHHAAKQLFKLTFTDAHKGEQSR
ncbi:hypothetical protein LCGC14_2451880 [marine sediment metagenome]|uniref:RNA ligase domain-containing protein n=1 Tax=marine sediment metagenome TaxID=412755 RepID=A0A0F9E9U0_9ZZZZ